MGISDFETFTPCCLECSSRNRMHGRSTSHPLLPSQQFRVVLVLIYLVRKAFEEKRILFLCQFYHLVQCTKLLSSITSTLVLYCRVQRKKWGKGYLLYLLFLIHTGKQHMTSVYYKCSQLIPYIFLLKYERYIYTFS